MCGKHSGVSFGGGRSSSISLVASEREGTCDVKMRRHAGARECVSRCGCVYNVMLSLFSAARVAYVELRCYTRPACSLAAVFGRAHSTDRSLCSSCAMTGCSSTMNACAIQLWQAMPALIHLRSTADNWRAARPATASCPLSVPNRMCAWPLLDRTGAMSRERVFLWPPGIHAGRPAATQCHVTAQSVRQYLRTERHVVLAAVGCGCKESARGISGSKECAAASYHGTWGTSMHGHTGLAQAPA